MIGVLRRSLHFPPGWAYAALALLVGLAVTLSGYLPWNRAQEVLVRAWPVLVFLILLKILADLCDLIGLFDVTADWIARRGGQRLRMVFVGFCLLATATTWLLSLDTTAVLLTPVAIGLAQRLGVSPLPWVMACAWLATGASLLLPVSNLTNLLAYQQLRGGTERFVHLSGAPQLVVVAITIGLLLIVHRRDLRSAGSTASPSAAPDAGQAGVGEPDRTLLWIGSSCAVLLGLTITAGVSAPLAAGLAVLILGAATAVRRREPLPVARLVTAAPWSLLVLSTGLFLAVAAVGPIIDAAWVNIFGTPTDALPGLMSIAAAGGAGANLLNNLPAYLALEPLVDSDLQTMALLIGTISHR